MKHTQGKWGNNTTGKRLNGILITEISHQKGGKSKGDIMHIKTIFWVCKVEKLVRGEFSTNKPILHLEPETWFNNEFDALKWIQEFTGNWTIVKVFETT